MRILRLKILCILPLLFLSLASGYVRAKSVDPTLARQQAVPQTSAAFQTTGHTPGPAFSRTTLGAAIDKAIDGAISRDRLVGAVVLVSLDGNLVYRRAAGFADRESRIPMAENTLFRLSSVSKPFTSMAAAALLQQGVLRLDDPVTKWLPWFTPSRKNSRAEVITIRQLMTHTAGLNYAFSEKNDGPYHRAGVSDGMDNSGLSLEENLRRIASAPLLFQPGSSMQYSTATDVLGAVIAKARGTSLPEAMHSLVLGPLGMRDTGFYAKDPARLAVPYKNTRSAPARMRDDEYIGRIHFSPGRALDAKAFASGGAGMVGTAPEVLLLLETIRKGGAPLAGPDIMKKMTTDQISPLRVAPGQGFSLGWGILTDPAASGSPQSAGSMMWGGVYGHSWFIDPARKLSVVMLTNTALEGMSGQVVNDLIAAVYANIYQLP